MSISTQSEFFRDIKKHPDRFYIIHYSCQNLNDDNEGLWPQVTAHILGRTEAERGDWSAALVRRADRPATRIARPNWANGARATNILRSRDVLT